MASRIYCLKYFIRPQPCHGPRLRQGREYTCGAGLAEDGRRNCQEVRFKQLCLHSRIHGSAHIRCVGEASSESSLWMGQEFSFCRSRHRHSRIQKIGCRRNICALQQRATYDRQDRARRRSIGEADIQLRAKQGFEWFSLIPIRYRRLCLLKICVT